MKFKIALWTTKHIKWTILHHKKCMRLKLLVLCVMLHNIYYLMHFFQFLLSKRLNQNVDGLMVKNKHTHTTKERKKWLSLTLTAYTSDTQMHTHRSMYCGKKEVHNRGISRKLKKKKNNKKTEREKEETLEYRICVQLLK